MYAIRQFGAPVAIRRADRDSARRPIRHTQWAFSNLACIWVVQMCLRLNMHLLYMYVWIYTIFAIGTLFGAPIDIRRDDRRAGWYRCVSKLNMHVLWMYVYIDAPGVLGVLYMYICMHYLAKYWARRSARWVVLMCLKLNVYVLWMYVGLYIYVPEYWEYYICMYVCM